MSRTRRLLMVGLDAVDGPRALRWMEEGELPVLAGIARRGLAQPMSTIGRHMPEASWASFVSGCTPGDHGAYSWRIVAPRSVDRVRTADGGARIPFWRVLRERCPEPSPRVTLFDVPYGGSEQPAGVVSLGGWGLRVTRRISASPAGLWDELSRNHDPYPTWINRDYVRGPLSERRYRRVLSDLARRRTDLALDVLGRSDWELAIVNYTENHYAAHAFQHHIDGIEEPPRRVRLGARTGLLDVCRATDRELGRLLAAVGPGVDVIVFSTLGNRPNEASEELLGHVLTALGYQAPATATSTPSLRRRVVGAGVRVTPRLVRHRIRALLPGGTVESIADSAWGESIDWTGTRAASEAEPGSSWIRLNLAGREPGGIVSPAERDGLIEDIERDLAELVDEDSGQPAVREVLRVRDLAPGERSEDLPDLLVRWTPGIRIKAVRHPRVGRITDHGGHHARTEHTGAGLLVAAGPAFVPGASADSAREVDLGPTVLHMFGCPVPEAMSGEPLLGLLRDPAPVAREDIDLSTRPSWEGARGDPSPAVNGGG